MLEPRHGAARGSCAATGARDWRGHKRDAVRLARAPRFRRPALQPRSQEAQQTCLVACIAVAAANQGHSGSHGRQAVRACARAVPAPRCRRQGRHHAAEARCGGRAVGCAPRRSRKQRSCSGWRSAQRGRHTGTWRVPAQALSCALHDHPGAARPLHACLQSMRLLLGRSSRPS